MFQKPLCYLSVWINLSMLLNYRNTSVIRKLIYLATSAVRCPGLKQKSKAIYCFSTIKIDGTKYRY